MSILSTPTDALGNEVLNNNQLRTESLSGESTSAEDASTIENDDDSAAELKTDAVSKLYANKYKTPEDLEAAYVEAQRKITEQGTRLKEIAAPEEYKIEVELMDDTKGQLIEMAKEGGWTQAQFNKFTEKLVARQASKIQEVTQAQAAVKETLGDEKMSRLDAYIDINYPAKLASALKTSYRNDKEIAVDLYTRREASLNVQFSAGNGSHAAPADQKTRLRELAQKMEAEPNNPHIRRQFEELSRVGLPKSNF